MLVRGLAVLATAGLSACRPADPAPPSESSVPLVAAAGLDVTLDVAIEPLIIEDDARRHSPPPEALRRRIYQLDLRLFRWQPPARPIVRPGLFLAPYRAPSIPPDRVVLLGHPAPAPGERFVVFDETGRLAVVEATGETCPPDVDGCIACADGDPDRRHWARVIDGSTRDHEYALALGPFAADEPLPSPRTLYDRDVRRGRWRLTDAMDLDGDGALDRVLARGDCHPERRCRRVESWRRHDDRWYAEPEAPRPPPAPMHLLAPVHWGDARLLPYRAYDPEIGGPGYVVATPSEIDDIDPTAGDYWILTPRGVVGRVHFSGSHPRSWCFSHGPECHEGEIIDQRPSPPGSQHLLVGPIPDPAVAVRRVELPKRPRHTTRWDPNRAAEELDLELTDGTRWTVTSRPCFEETPDRVHSGTCFDTRIERPGAPPHRHITGSFNILNHPVTTSICHDPLE